jgi:pimeloyl-ACP methyl ester carboxylesterase
MTDQTVGSPTPPQVFGNLPRHRLWQVPTPDGVTIAAQDWRDGQVRRDAGKPARRSLLLIHGYSQSHRCWLRQLNGPLAREFDLVSYDLRGHGDSDKPMQARYYRETPRWADEVRSVIETLALERPVIVAWSYAGRVILDYLSVYGTQALGGLVMVSAASTAGPQVTGPAGVLLDRMGDRDPAVASEATRAFLAACVAQPLPAEEFQYMLAYNEQVPPPIRGFLRGRPANYGELLSSLALPTLTICGELDAVNLPAMTRYTASLVPGVRSLWYEGIGHMPFWEAPQRFDADLAQFVRSLA